MAKEHTLQLYRGTTAQNNAYTGSAGEPTFDTTTNEVRIHDGSTQGGHILQGKMTVDASPTNGSSNPVQSGGVYTALSGKQDTLSFDATPTDGSSNPVTSDGIYSALSTKQDTMTVDATPVSASTNPVQSGGVYSALATKVDISGGDASATVATATGSTDERTLSDWTSEILAVQNVKCGKRIVFTADFKCPDYDELMSMTFQEGTTNRYIYPQAINIFTKDSIDYLFILSGASLSGTGTGNVTQIVTVYRLDTGEYQGYLLLPNVPTTEGLVVKSESDGDYIYIAKSGYTLQKFEFTLGTYGVTLTGTDVVDADGNSISTVWFLSYMNGTWCIQGASNRVGGFSSRTLYFYDDEFNLLGQWDVQNFQQDVWSAYEGLTDDQKKIQWSIPRTQGIVLGVDGIYFFKGGGTNSEDTTYPITDCGVDHYSFNGELVRTSVCDHTLFATRMLSQLGLTSSINHTECESGFCTEDGKCFWFGVVGSDTGKIVLLEEFSEESEAIDFSDCLANRQSNIPYQSNRPFFPHGIDSGITNPWTGEQITSCDDFISMCAIWGLDDVCVSNYSAGLGTTIYNTTVSSSENFVLHVRRYSYNRMLVDVLKNAVEMPFTYVVGLDSGFNVTSCTLQNTLNTSIKTNVGDFINETTDAHYLRINGGTGISGGASLWLHGKNQSSYLGQFRLQATDGSDTSRLIGKSDGTLTWDGNSIQTSSDERLKTSLETVPDEILDAWGDVQWGQFQFLSAVAEKGENARLHMGLIAQRVKAVFEARGLDACAYGILCHEEREAEIDEDGTEISPAFEQWMVRYTEALAMEAAYQRRRADRIEARLTAIEERLK